MHTCEKMFHLVDKVEDYPAFLPWCGGTQLIKRTDTETQATIHIDYHGVKQKFTTSNSKTFPNRMDIALIDGPFKQLHGFWSFTPLAENACKIEFELQYEFSSYLLEKLIAPVFSYITDTFVDSFVSRADQLESIKQG